jgi:hypothetical protein
MLGWRKTAPKSGLDSIAVLTNQGVAGAGVAVVAGAGGIVEVTGAVVTGAVGVVVVVDVVGAVGAGVTGAGVAGAAGVVIVVVDVVFDPTGVACRFIIKITTIRMTMMTAAAPMIVFRLFIVFPPAVLAWRTRQDAFEGGKRLRR